MDTPVTNTTTTVTDAPVILTKEKLSEYDIVFALDQSGSMSWMSFCSMVLPNYMKA